MLISGASTHRCFVNLDRRGDRLVAMRTELQRVGIKMQRRPGILPEDFKGDWSKVMVMSRRTPGAIGCFYAQRAILEEAKALGKHAWVNEDDLVFCSDIGERLNYIHDYLNHHDWDIFFLGGTYHINPPWWHTGKNRDLPGIDYKLYRDAELTDDPRIIRTYGCFSTHSYMVNHGSIDKVLGYLDQYVHEAMGIDWLLIKVQPLMNCFAFAPGCVIQRDNMSDIGRGITKFSGFSKLGAHWFGDKMQDFDPLVYDWHEARVKNNGYATGTL